MNLDSLKTKSKNLIIFLIVCLLSIACKSKELIDSTRYEGQKNIIKKDINIYGKSTSWSPDGKNVMYLDVNYLRVFNIKSTEEISSIELSTYIQDVTQVHDLLWVFENVVFLAARIGDNEDNYSLVQINLDTNQSTILIDNQQLYKMCWLPTESKIIYLDISDEEKLNAIALPTPASLVKSLHVSTLTTEILYDVEDPSKSIKDLVCNPKKFEYGIVVHELKFTINRDSLILIEPEKKIHRNIFTRVESFSPVFSWSFDGKWLIERQNFRRNTPLPQVNIYSVVEDIIFENVIKHNGRKIGWIDWSPVGNVLLVSERYKGANSLSLTTFDFLTE